MKPANLLRWYPRAWRERYGEELLALIQDTLDEGRPTWRLRLGVIWGGLRERVHQAVRAGTAAALVAASGLWASAATATAKHLKLATRARAAQPLLAAVTMTAALAMVPANLIWLAAIQSSLPWLVVGVANLALVSVLAPRRIGQAVRQGRRLRAAASGRTVINPSVHRTHGRHRA